MAQVLLVQHKSIGFWPHIMWLKSELSVAFPKAEQTQEPSWLHSGEELDTGLLAMVTTGHPRRLTEYNIGMW